MSAGGLAGMVLAGGRGRRLGRDKATVELDGERLVDRVVAELGRVAAPVVVVGGADRRITGLDVRQVSDREPDAGPLVGIVSGLAALRDRRHTAVVAVDLPGVSSTVLRYLHELAVEADVDAVVPVVDGRMQPLHAVLASSCEPILTDLVTAGERSVVAAFATLAVREVTDEALMAAGLPLDFARDVDTPEDLAAWRSPDAGQQQP